MSSDITTLDLFAGAGGLSAGLVQADRRFRTVRAVESDIAAAATFDANHGAGSTYAGSIETWLAEEEVPEVDLVVGGPPCQGFSALNRARVGSERNGLWERYAETLVRARPKWFVMENVPQFLHSAELEAFRLSTLPGQDLAEWTLEAKVLIASEHGAPQRRRRAVVIGYRKDVARPLWPVATHLAGHQRTVREALVGINPEVTRVDLPERTTIFRDRELPGAFTSRELHVTRKYEEKSLLRFGHIPEGGNRHDLPDELKAPCWLGHSSGSGDVMGRLRLDQPSVTIRTEFFKPEKGRYLHPFEHRAITHHEAARLQGFPDNYLWVGTKLQIARQIGNAVPLALGKALGEVLSAAYQSSTTGEAAARDGAGQLELI
ncbi:DNA cytosine methyltransferase [Serinicoccus marinus]|uniref:DNA cytosine methyltransferase n=1 Tax=Serinicoccus marinus TaxID=247333 RepID=UPI0024914DBC|nr:DNA cytosine methyltransferase [Serinicoccus marinus]